MPLVVRIFTSFLYRYKNKIYVNRKRTKVHKFIVQGTDTYWIIKTILHVYIYYGLIELSYFIPSARFVFVYIWALMLVYSSTE